MANRFRVPGVLARRLDELGLIDSEGRVSSQLGGDAETLPITSPHILAR